jgi:hypothetical protein
MNFIHIAIHHVYSTRTSHAFFFFVLFLLINAVHPSIITTHRLQPHSLRGVFLLVLSRGPRSRKQFDGEAVDQV